MARCVLCVCLCVCTACSGGVRNEISGRAALIQWTGTQRATGWTRGREGGAIFPMKRACGRKAGVESRRRRRGGGGGAEREREEGEDAELTEGWMDRWMMWRLCRIGGEGGGLYCKAQASDGSSDRAAVVIRAAAAEGQRRRDCAACPCLSILSTRAILLFPSGSLAAVAE